jgi:arsenate reductase (glutaredoxin)
VSNQVKRSAPGASSGSHVQFYEYAACGTCKKARRWLDDHGVALDAVPIVERTPAEGELHRLVAASGLPARRWFNTSGQSYRALIAERGKTAVEALTAAEILALLAKDGKLIRRPVLVAGERVLVGFREDEYAALLR